MNPIEQFESERAERIVSLVARLVASFYAA